MSKVGRLRDTRLVDTQATLAACVAAIAKSISSYVLTQHQEDYPHLEHMCDAARLLVHTFHEQNNIRQKIIIASLNSTWQAVLSKTQSDDFLFGKNLTEVLKSAKLLEQSAAQLKPKSVSTSKNLKAPPRPPPPHPQGMGGHKPPYRRPRSQNRPTNRAPRNDSRSSRNNHPGTTDRNIGTSTGLSPIDDK